MSAMFEKIRRYYEEGLWSAKRVYDAYVKGKITLEEYNLILNPEPVPVVVPTPEEDPTPEETPAPANEPAPEDGEGADDGTDAD